MTGADSADGRNAIGSVNAAGVVNSANIVNSDDDPYSVYSVRSVPTVHS